MANYQVEAKLVINDKQSRKAISRIKKSLSGLTRGIDRVNKKFRMMGTAAQKAQRKATATMGGGRGMAPGRALGGEYMKAAAATAVIFAGSRAMLNQVAAASEFRKEMEMAEFTIAALDSTVNKIPIEQALGKANEQMFRFNKMAAQAPGGPQDMVSIYQRLFGIMSRGGKTIEEIEKATVQTAIAGKLFGIKDTGALGRDVEEMLSGRAGIRTTKLFALGKSTGLLKETTKQWNALTDAKRLEKTTAFLELFQKHGVRLGKTWEGSSESFGGWLALFRDVFARDTFSVLAGELFKINKMMEKNLVTLRSYFSLGGASVARRVEGIAGGVSGAAGMIQKTPVVLTETAMYGGLVAAMMTIMSLMSSLASILGVTTGPLAAVAGIMASGFLPALGVAIGVVTALVTIFEVLTDQGGNLAAVFGGGVMAVMSDVFHIFTSAFRTVIEVFKIIASVILNVLAPVFGMMVTGLRVFAGVIIVVFEVVRSIAEAMYTVISTLFSVLGGGTVGRMQEAGRAVSVTMEGVYTSIMQWMIKIADGLAGFFGKLRIRSMEDMMFAISQQLRMAMGRGKRRLRMVAGEEQKRKKERKRKKEFGGPSVYPEGPQINVQRMIINQEFKGKTDPDRVVAAFKKAITDQAESAISSIGDIPLRA